MAEHLASIFGTEKDRVNCPFYFKIGACRHGDGCSRLQAKPGISPTLLLSNMYQRSDIVTPTPRMAPIRSSQPSTWTLARSKDSSSLFSLLLYQHGYLCQHDFDEDLFEELSEYGEIKSLNICDNLADHMDGNVYVQFREKEHAANALRNLMGRFYAG